MMSPKLLHTHIKRIELKVPEFLLFLHEASFLSSVIRVIADLNCFLK